MALVEYFLCLLGTDTGPNPTFKGGGDFEFDGNAGTWGSFCGSPIHHRACGFKITAHSACPYGPIPPFPTFEEKVLPSLSSDWKTAVLFGGRLPAEREIETGTHPIRLQVLTPPAPTPRVFRERTTISNCEISNGALWVSGWVSFRSIRPQPIFRSLSHPPLFGKGERKKWRRRDGAIYTERGVLLLPLPLQLQLPPSPSSRLRYIKNERVVMGPKSFPFSPFVGRRVWGGCMR